MYGYRLKVFFLKLTDDWWICYRYCSKCSTYFSQRSALPLQDFAPMLWSIRNYAPPHKQQVFYVAFI